MPPRKNTPKEILENLYVNQRKTIKEISEILGLNTITVTKNMREHGLVARDVNSEKSLLTKLNITDEQLKSMLRFKYEFKKMSINKISRELDVSARIITKYLERYGIKLRNHKEANKVSNSMDKNHKWNGGTRSVSGYVQILVPDHPCAIGNGYIYEHRYIMEQHIGRFLETEEHVHHLNGNKTDNRIENLQLISNIEHARIHMTERHKAKKKG